MIFQKQSVISHLRNLEVEVEASLLVDLAVEASPAAVLAAVVVEAGKL